MDTIGPDYIKAAAQASPLFLKYGQTIDRESAYEMLASQAGTAARGGRRPAADPADRYRPAADAQKAREARARRAGEVMNNPAFKSAMRSAGTVIGREIVPKHLRHRPPQLRPTPPPSFLYTAPTIGVTIARGA